MKKQIIISQLHNTERVGAIVTYPPKAGQEANAKKAWQWTGICSTCHHRAIAAGHCKHCGTQHG